MTKRYLAAMLVAMMAASLFFGCAKEEHWGQNLNPKGSWWKKEGHSWDPKEKIFMAIGYSNPDWKDKFDQRKSADLNARAEVANFMQSLTKNYMKEIRASRFAISQSVVEESSKETLLGAVIVARHYTKGKHQFESLIKVDLNYFFNHIYDKYENEQMISGLKEIENAIVEKTIGEGGTK
jgi:hypothetical protein